MGRRASEALIVCTAVSRAEVFAMSSTPADTPGDSAPSSSPPTVTFEASRSTATGIDNASAASTHEAHRYQRIRFHRRGGIGEVHFAKDLELNRLVALKELQSHLADDQARRSRFIVEAEITGGLDHPGVVPIYGLGRYDDGRPFYAMRFIQGSSLRESIAEFHKGPGQFDSLEFQQLLRRYIDVCNTIAFAHSRGVLHRDLKPSNIMLGPYGETLVVDWGLAKATGTTSGSKPDDPVVLPLQPASDTETSATAAGQIIGTPGYMSPEQAAGRLDELGPATDIYSLGATLYELLTGQMAFRDVGSAELYSTIREGQFVSPRQVKPAIPRPLEALCLKAMAREPGSRYASALDLARDVERWLADEPVTADREPWPERARRWARKHRTLVTTGIAAIGLLAAGLGALVWQSENARLAMVQKEKETANARDQAVEARNYARQTLDDMISDATSGSLTTQKEISPEQRRFLTNAIAYYEKFASEPGEDRQGRERLASAHARLGGIHRRLGDASRAAAIYDQAARQYRALTADFPDAAEYWFSLAGALGNIGNSLDGINQFQRAEASFREAAAIAEKLSGNSNDKLEYQQLLARTHNSLGVLCQRMGRRPDAETAYRTALRIRTELYARDPELRGLRTDLATSYSNFGLLMHQMGRLKDAEDAHVASLALRKELLDQSPLDPDRRRDVARANFLLADALWPQRRQPDALNALTAARTALDELVIQYPLNPQYRMDLVRCHATLGRRRVLEGKPAEAEADLHLAITHLERLTADNPKVANYREELVRAYNAQGAAQSALRKFASAEASFRAAIAMQQKTVSESPLTEYRVLLAECDRNFGQTLLAQDKLDQALEAYRSALEIYHTLSTAAPENKSLRRESATTRLLIADLHVRRGDYSQALTESELVASAEANDASTLFDCACVQSAASTGLDSNRREPVARRAVALLERAVRKGFRDFERLMTDSDLNPLRARSDFADLLWQCADMPAKPTGK